MKKRIFKVVVFVASLAMLLGASGAAAQKPTQRTPYQTWDGKEEEAVQQQARFVQLVGQIDTPASAVDVVVSESYAYIAGEDSGLRIIDVSDPSTPSEIGFYDTPTPPGSVWGVAVSGNYAYLADSDGGLRIIDVSNPANPSETGFYITEDVALDVAVAGSYAYVADQYYGLRIIDISDPANPSEAGFYDTPDSVYAVGVAVSGNYAYVVEHGVPPGLRIIDVSDPTNPSEAGFYETYWTSDVAISGGYAYVADDMEGLRIIDISDPTAPSETGFYNTSGTAQSVVVSGNYAYVADGDKGLRIIDVSDPTNPSEAGFYDTPDFATSVTVDGNLTYVADNENGLVILRFYPHQIYLPFITRPCLPLFSDDFSDPNSGWPVKDDGNLRYEYLDGEYRILVRNTDWWAAARPDFQASDYIFAADVRNKAGTWGSYGLIFGISSDWSQFYTFEIFPDGYYGIYRYNSGIWTSFTEGTSGSINIGTAKNRLKIKREGTLIEAYANGQLLASVSDGSYTGMRYVGLFAGTYDEPNLDVRIDNFVVYSVTCRMDGAQIGETIQAPNLKSFKSVEHGQIFGQPNSRKR